MLDRPWIRLLLGVLAAAALGALAARVAGSVPGGSGPSHAAAPGADGARSRSGGGAGAGAGGSSSSGGAASAAGRSGGVEVSGGSGQLTVHVTGAVRRPGVYRLREGARIFEAVRKAGGASGRADRQRLNLAAAVRDGQQVLVPERVAPVGSGGRATTGRGDAAGGGSGAAGAGEGTPVDLNTAGVEELQGLEGVGPTTAEKIVRLREERGGLGGVDDLDEVPGIGPKKLDALRAQLEP